MLVDYGTPEAVTAKLQQAETDDAILHDLLTSAGRNLKDDSFTSMATSLQEQRASNEETCSPEVLGQLGGSAPMTALGIQSTPPLGGTATALDEQPTTAVPTGGACAVMGQQMFGIVLAIVLLGMG